MKKRNALMFGLAAFACLPLSVYAATESTFYRNPNVSYEDLDESDTVSMGDKVTVGTESFYVIDLDDTDSSFRMLAEKRIDCTALVQDEDAPNLQISTNSNYGSSGVAECTNNYVDALNESYGIGSNAELLRKSQLTSLGFSYSQANGVYNGTFDWVGTTDFYYFHHHNTYNMDYVGRVYMDGDTLRGQELTSDTAGVRPFIKVPNALLDEFTITLNDSENGTYTLTRGENNVFTFNITPNDGYELDTIKVIDLDNDPVEVTDGKFTMPEKDVTVTVTFKAVPVTAPEIANPQTSDNLISSVILLLLGATGIASTSLYLKKEH